MKFIAFGVAFVIGTPLMAMAAIYSHQLRGLLMALLVFSTALGDVAGINFVSMEYYRGPDRGYEVNLSDLIAIALLIAVIVKFPSKIKWVPYNTTWLFLFFCACMYIDV